MSERAYFTPTREEIFELQKGLLEVPSGVSIHFNTLGVADTSDEMPNIYEHSLRVERLVFTAAGYAIFGTENGENGALKAKLEVDITQEPPVATYELFTE